jgi:hypothetical protein
VISWHSLLYLDPLPFDLIVLEIIEHPLHTVFLHKRNKSEASWSSCVFILHNSCVLQLTELVEKLSELFVGDVLGKSAHKYLFGPMLLISRWLCWSRGIFWHSVFTVDPLPIDSLRHAQNLVN